MLPDGVLLDTPVVSPYLYQVRGKLEPLVDYEMGGRAIQDPSAGLAYQNWTLRWASGNFYLSADQVAEQYVFSEPDVIRVALAFDQNMQPFIAFETDSSARFRWYQTSSSSFVISDLPAGSRNVCAIFDEKRPQLLGKSDILLFYQRGTALYYRQQRDNYATEYLLREDIGGELTAAGMTRGHRIQFRVA